jgi:hypothetical protein
MKIDTIEKLQQIFNENSCNNELEEDSFKKTIYVDKSIFDSLIKYDLDFEPYIKVAKECLMQSIQIMQSTKTNRIYIGFVNLGGHSPAYEIRPVRLIEILNIDYIEKMFNNYGQELDWGIDINEKYEV